MSAASKPAKLFAPKRIMWIVALVVIAAAGSALFMCRPTSPPPASPSASAQVAQPAPAPAAPAKKVDDAGQERLVGRWLRPDGGYILEIRSAAPDGKLDAGYFNPGPIHVARAEWKQKDGKLSVFVELRDVNYPGSTYTLEFVEAEDRMVGVYFQAVERVNFDVEFVREN